MKYLYFLSWLSLVHAHSQRIVHDESFQPDHILRVTRGELRTACTSRDSALVNGTSPGPAITLIAGQTSFIRVYNDMKNENLTMHWHGLSLSSFAPFSDGTPLASQWPIPPEHFFDYEIQPNLNETGSFFYHSHVGFQAVSAAGPLIVKEPEGVEPPYAYDEERIFFFSELYNRTDESIVDGLLGAPFVWSGEPEKLLCNGRGTAVANKTNDECAPEVFEVEPSKVYRFRFIGGQALATTFLALQNHTFDVIAADGSYTMPAHADYLQINSGQRFDVLLRTKSREELEGSDPWFTFQFQTAYRPTIVAGQALLHYNLDVPDCSGLCYGPGSSLEDTPAIPSDQPKNISTEIPAVGDNTTNRWLEDTLTPLYDTDFPSASEVTRTIYLRNVQVQWADKQILWEINNHTWAAEVLNSSYMSAPRGVPYLVNIYKNGQAAVPTVEMANEVHQEQVANNSKALYTGWTDFNAYPAQIGEVLDIVLLNEAGFSGSFDVHPWHAHGHHYHDLGTGPGMYDPVENEKKLARLRAESGYVPALRDTTILNHWPANNKVNETMGTVGGWRAWRLRVTDPGVFLIHCHSTQHALMSMTTVWVMGDAQQILRGDQPPAGWDTFGDNVVGPQGTSNPQRMRSIPSPMEGYLEFGGRAYGNATHWPVVMHHFT